MGQTTDERVLKNMSSNDMPQPPHSNHQKFKVYMNLTSENMLFFGCWGFPLHKLYPYIQLIHTAHLFSRPCLLRAEGGEGHQREKKGTRFGCFYKVYRG